MHTNEVNVAVCECTNPFCDLAHADLAVTLAEIEAMTPPDDDWEGPALPEYSEVDEEAYYEMVREELRWAR